MSVVLIKNSGFLDINIKVHLEHSEWFLNDWPESVSVLLPWSQQTSHRFKKKQSVNYFQGMETEILRWFTDDSDFCVSLLLYLLPRELGAYFLPHFGYKKYQQKPQERNLSTLLLKMANGLPVSYTERLMFYLWKWYPWDTEMPRCYSIYLSIAFIPRLSSCRAFPIKNLRCQQKSSFFP